ncbi:MAG: Ty1/Copia family ribonuclease HI [Planctomycetaceae bacterium]|nr:Ty1/Copia family ribonuclease HI [Planctomycetaceae bacterium]
MDSDRRLHRIFSFINGFSGLTLRGSLSTADRDSSVLIAWPDADHAGDFMITKSTSGYFVELASSRDVTKPERNFPITWGCNKQGSTSQHTGEAETISLATCLRKELIPVQILMSKLLRRPIDAIMCEDNNTTISAIQKGYSPNMRHIARTQRTSIGLLHEMIVEPEENQPEGKIELIKVDTKIHKGDMFTKELEVRDYIMAIDRIGVQ